MLGHTRKMLSSGPGQLARDRSREAGQQHARGQPGHPLPRGHPDPRVVSHRDGGRCVGFEGHVGQLLNVTHV